MPHVWQALTVVVYVALLIMMTFGIPILAFRTYHKRRHFRHAKRAILFRAAFAETFGLATLVVPLRVLVGWSILSGDFQLPFGITLPVAATVSGGLMCVAIALLGMSFQYMPDNTDGRTSGVPDDTPR